VKIKHVPSCLLDLIQEYGILHSLPCSAAAAVRASSAFLTTVKERKVLVKVMYVNLFDSALPQLDEEHSVSAKGTFRSYRSSAFV